MDILIIMCAGIAAGRFLTSKRTKKWNEKMQLICTLLLIFSMGVLLGRKENFLEELSSLGITSFLFFLIPTALSVFSVYYLTKYFMEKQEAKHQEKEWKEEW